MKIVVQIEEGIVQGVLSDTPLDDNFELEVRDYTVSDDPAFDYEGEDASGRYSVGRWVGGEFKPLDDSTP